MDTGTGGTCDDVTLTCHAAADHMVGGAENADATATGDGAGARCVETDPVAANSAIARTGIEVDGEVAIAAEDVATSRRAISDDRAGGAIAYGDAIIGVRDRSRAGVVQADAVAQKLCPGAVEVDVDAAFAVATDEVAGTGSDTTDGVVRRTVLQEHSVVPVRDRGGTGGVGADQVAQEGVRRSGGLVDKNA